MHTSIVSILFVVKKVNFSRFFKVFSSAPIFSILSSVNLNKVCHQLKSCHQHLPDVGQILKNKINSDFFWFCYSCFPKSRNICRPIIFVQVHRPYLVHRPVRTARTRDLWTFPLLRYKDNFEICSNSEIVSFVESFCSNWSVARQSPSPNG